MGCCISLAIQSHVQNQFQDATVFSPSHNNFHQSQTVAMTSMPRAQPTRQPQAQIPIPQSNNPFPEPTIKKINYDLTKEAGDDFYKKGEFEDAVVAYTGAIEKDKSNHILFSNRSAAYLGNGDYSSAVIDAVECIRLAPEFVKGYLRKGQALAKLKLFDSAEEAFKEGLARFPDDKLIVQAMNEAETFRKNLPDDVVNSKTSTIGHSSLLVEHIIAFMRHRKKIAALWDSIKVTGEVERIDPIDLIVSARHPGGFDPGSRQVATSGSCIETLSELYEIAALTKPVFDAFVNDIIGSMVQADPAVTVQLAPLKGKERAAAKAADDYGHRTAGPGEAWLFDIVRGSIECNSESQIVEIVSGILSSPIVEVVRLKNRFQTPTPAGFRDININIKIRLPSIGPNVFHICELQVHHAQIKSFGKANHSHSHYEYFRVYFSGSVEAVDKRLSIFEEMELFDQPGSQGTDGNGENILMRVTKAVVKGSDVEKLEDMSVLLTLVNEWQLKELCSRRLLELRSSGAVIDSEILRTKNELAANLQLQGKADEARVILEEIVAMIPSLPYESEQDRWRELAFATQNLGLVLIDLGLLQQAKSQILGSLEIMRRLRGKLHIDTAYGLHQLGIVSIALQEIDNAVSSLEQALFIRQREYGEQCIAVADSMMRLAEGYGFQAKFERAIELGKNAVEICKRVSGEDDRFTLTAIGILGSIYKESGDLDSALVCYKKSREGYLKMHGSSHVNCAVALVNEASLYAAKQDWGSAYPLVVKALEISQKHFNSDDHPVIATCYNNLGALYHSQAQFELASKYFVKGLTIRLKVLGPNHVHTGKTYCDLGTSQVMLGQLTESAQNLESGLKIYKLNNVNNLDIATCLNSIGPLYQKLGRLQDATAALTEALELFKKTYSDSDINVGTVYNNLGMVYRDLNMLPEAEACIGASLQCFVANLGPSHLNTMNIAGNLGTVLVKYPDAGKQAQGRDLINRTLQYLRGIGLDANHPYVAKFLMALNSSPTDGVVAQVSTKQCVNRHSMAFLTTNVPQYAAMNGHPKCDKCLVDIINFSEGFYHCNTCGFDLCAHCSK